MEGGGLEGEGLQGQGKMKGGHTQHIIKKEDINKAKHTYPKAAVLHRLF
mgnify:CR=1 FL=1